MSISTLSMESVSFQNNTDFFNELLVTVGQYVHNDPGNKKFTDSVNRVIKKHTNLRFSTSVTEDVSASIMVPRIDHNGIFNRVKSGLSVATYGYYLLACNKDNPIGWVDYKTGKVHGVFEDIRFDLLLGQHMFALFTPEQVATSILHEVGHAYTYCAKMGVEVIGPLGLMALTKDLLMVTSGDVHNDRVAIVKTFSKETGIKIADPNKLAKADNIVDCIVELNKDYNADFRSATGNDLNDIKLWETMADQYAIRMGGGVHLAAVIKKVYELVPLRPTNNSIVGFLSGLTALILLAAASGLVAGPAIAAIWLTTRQYSGNTFISKKAEYHSPAERVRKIKQELVLRLRLGNFPDKQQLLKEIDEVEKMIVGLYDEAKLAKDSLFWFMTSADRKAYVNDLDLDNIARNDLFIRGHQLSSK